MKLKNIKIENLFGLEQNNFDIDCFPNEFVTILYGFNGIGKTTILRLVDAILNINVSVLKKIKFNRIELRFDDEKKIVVKKEVESLEYDYIGLPQSEEFLNDLCNMMKEKVGAELSVLKYRGLLYSCDSSEEGVCLLFNNSEVKIHISNRSDNKKTNFSIGNNDFNDDEKQNALNIYFSKVLTLNSTFVNNNQLYFKNFDELVINPEELIGESVKIWDYSSVICSHKETEEGIEFNLSDGNKLLIKPFDSDNKEEKFICTAIDKKNRSDIDLFLRIINENFGLLNKKLVFDDVSGFKILSKMKKTEEIQFSQLSAGEKKLIIMFSEVIFKRGINSDTQTLVFIEEPENSLYIEWQQNFIKSILEICSKNKTLQFLIVSHSPDIVDEYWGLQSEIISLGLKNEL